MVSGMSTNWTELGQRLREARQAQGLSRAALARHLDVSVSTLATIEGGGRNYKGQWNEPSPDDRLLIRLADLLTVDRAMVFDLAGRPFPTALAVKMDEERTLRVEAGTAEWAMNMIVWGLSEGGREDLAAQITKPEQIAMLHLIDPELAMAEAVALADLARRIQEDSRTGDRGNVTTLLRVLQVLGHAVDRLPAGADPKIAGSLEELERQFDLVLQSLEDQFGTPP